MLVEKYCAVCRTDAVRNGGLSLQHFDARNVAPSLAAMMVSKLTSGVSLEAAKIAASDANAAALVATKMKGGAMGVAGIPIPDTTSDSRAHRRSGRAKEWHVSQPTTRGPGCQP